MMWSVVAKWACSNYMSPSVVRAAVDSIPGPSGLSWVQSLAVI